jgi:hypothetical protein
MCDFMNSHGISTYRRIKNDTREGKLKYKVEISLKERIDLAEYESSEYIFFSRCILCTDMQVVQRKCCYMQSTQKNLFIFLKFHHSY